MGASKNVQVLPVDDRSGEAASYFRQQLLGGCPPQKLMNQDEKLRIGLGSDPAQGRSGGMGCGVVPLPHRGSPLPSSLGIDVVDEDIAPPAVFQDGIGGSGVSGEDNGPVGGFEPVAEGLGPTAVNHLESRDPHVGVFEDHSGTHVLSLDQVAGWVGGLQTVQSDAYVRLLGLGEVTGHGLRACRADDPEGGLPLQNPGGENQIGKTHRVVGMEVCEEYRGEAF